MDNSKPLGAQCVEAIRARMAAENMNATYRTSNSLDFIESANELKVFLKGGQHAPAFSLQHGAGPHYNSEPTGFVEAIFEWVDAKGVQFEGRTVSQTAWAILQAIRRDGTRRYGKFTDIWQTVAEDAIPTFKERYNAYFKKLIIDIMR